MIVLRIKNCLQASVEPAGVTFIPNVSDLLLGVGAPNIGACPFYMKPKIFRSAWCRAGSFPIHGASSRHGTTVSMSVPPSSCPLRAGDGRMVLGEHLIPAERVVRDSDFERLKRLEAEGRLGTANS